MDKAKRLIIIVCTVVMTLLTGCSSKLGTTINISEKDMKYVGQYRRLTNGQTREYFEINEDGSVVFYGVYDTYDGNWTPDGDNSIAIGVKHLDSRNFQARLSDEDSNIMFVNEYHGEELSEDVYYVKVDSDTYKLIDWDNVSKLNLQLNKGSESKEETEGINIVNSDDFDSNDITSADTTETNSGDIEKLLDEFTDEASLIEIAESTTETISGYEEVAILLANEGRFTFDDKQKGVLAGSSYARPYHGSPLFNDESEEVYSGFTPEEEYIYKIEEEDLLHEINNYLGKGTAIYCDTNFDNFDEYRRLIREGNDYYFYTKRLRGCELFELSSSVENITLKDFDYIKEVYYGPYESSDRSANAVITYKIVNNAADNDGNSYISDMKIDIIGEIGEPHTN